MIPHVNIGGWPGAGKTSAALILALLYRTLWISRPTTRPIRLGEVDWTEYHFAPPDEYEIMQQSGRLLSWKGASGIKKVGKVRYQKGGRRVYEVEYKRGTPDPAYWAQPLSDTELMMSLFGRVAPELKRRLVPNMTNFFLVGEQWTLLDRLVQRQKLEPDSPSVEWHWKLIEKYKREKIEGGFDYVIDTTNLSSEEVAKTIAAKVGLESRIIIAA